MVGRSVVLEWRWGDARVAPRWAGKGWCDCPREEWMGGVKCGDRRGGWLLVTCVNKNVVRMCASYESERGENKCHRCQKNY